LKEDPISTAWEIPIAGFHHRGSFACQRIDPTPENSRPIVRDVLASRILSRAEREQYRELKDHPRRASDWLFGRVVVKDAVRQLLRSRHGMEVFPADVEISADREGRPFARILGANRSAAVPSVSIAHTAGLVAGLAGYCAEGERLGIDVERVRPRDEAFQDVAFGSRELDLLDPQDGLQREEAITRFWCAKEAVVKGLGGGVPAGPLAVGVGAWYPRTGIVEVVLGDKLAREFPELAGSGLIVYTAREADWAIACTLCERSDKRDSN